MTQSDDDGTAADERAAERLTMDYPAEILQKPTGKGTVKGRPGMKPVRPEETDPEAGNADEEKRP